MELFRTDINQRLKILTLYSCNFYSYISPFFYHQSPKFVSIFILIFIHFLPFLTQFSFLYSPCFYHFFSPKNSSFIGIRSQNLDQIFTPISKYSPLIGIRSILKKTDWSTKIAKIPKKKPYLYYYQIFIAPFF